MAEVHVASVTASLLLSIMLIAGSLWIHSMMIANGYIEWWQWVIPISVAGLIFVGAMKTIWS